MVSGRESDLFRDWKSRAAAAIIYGVGIANRTFGQKSDDDIIRDCLAVPEEQLFITEEDEVSVAHEWDKLTRTNATMLRRSPSVLAVSCGAHSPGTSMIFPYQFDLSHSQITSEPFQVNIVCIAYNFWL